MQENPDTKMFENPRDSAFEDFSCENQLEESKKLGDIGIFDGLFCF